MEIELCKAKLRLSHRCQPLTHTTVSGAGVAGEGGGQATQQPKLYGETTFLQGSPFRPPPIISYVSGKLKCTASEDLALVLVLNGN
jgi:hypothetical protein